jgi:hypothetical protein
MPTTETEEARASMEGATLDPWRRTPESSDTVFGWWKNRETRGLEAVKKSRTPLSYVRVSETAPCCERTYRTASVNERLHDRIFHTFLSPGFSPQNEATA